jgi:hypothetical protein
VSFPEKAVSPAVHRPVLPVLKGSGSTAARFQADVYVVLKAVVVLPLSAPVLSGLLEPVSSLYLNNHIDSWHTHKTRKPINYNLESSDLEVFNENTVHLRISKATMHTVKYIRVL